jgi:hypothetical protein
MWFLAASICKGTSSKEPQVGKCGSGECFIQGAVGERVPNPILRALPVTVMS